ncbi:Alpha-1B-glycoprotein [Myotis brandtii]|uniref:Alpha-1B-glycoprotein n=1 Tax=Myotis brandtii TaxID=109478 RepID=S7MEI8_MYOBR|nr:Alpha-1B-glycoprotein [Myotis brandtii]
MVTPTLIVDTRPDLWAEAGSLQEPWAKLTLVCRALLVTSEFQLFKDGELQERVRLSEGGLEHRFPLGAVTGDTRGLYRCRYAMRDNRWTSLSNLLEVTGAVAHQSLELLAAGEVVASAYGPSEDLVLTYVGPQHAGKYSCRYRSWWPLVSELSDPVELQVAGEVPLGSESWIPPPPHPSPLPSRRPLAGVPSPVHQLVRSAGVGGETAGAKALGQRGAWSAGVPGGRPGQGLGAADSSASFLRGLQENVDPAADLDAEGLLVPPGSAPPAAARGWTTPGAGSVCVGRQEGSPSLLPGINKCEKTLKHVFCQWQPC